MATFLLLLGVYVKYNHWNYITKVLELLHTLFTDSKACKPNEPALGTQASMGGERYFHWLLCVLLQRGTLIQLAREKQYSPLSFMIGLRRTSIKNERRCVAEASDYPDGPRKHRCLFHILLAIKTAEGQATLMETWNIGSAYFSSATAVSGGGVSSLFLFLLLLWCGFDSWRCLLLQADKFLLRLANTTGASSLRLPKY